MAAIQSTTTLQQGGSIPLRNVGEPLFAALRSVVTFLSSQVKKLLLAQVTPFAASKLPEPANLATWWENTMSVIQSLDNSYVGHLYDISMFTE